MKTLVQRSSKLFVVLSLLITLFATGASAGHPGTKIATPMVSGYDPVAYFEQGQPVRGSGYNTATYNGGTYLFATKAHKEMFQANPGKYAPQYGGYCAYGVAVGKKFYSDPNRWKVVDGKLYLNLDKGIQKKWNEDINGHIAKADAHWKDIEHKHPSKL